MRRRFLHRVQAALRNPSLQQALEGNAQRRQAAWQAAFATLPHYQELRHRAHERRQHTLDNLQHYVDEFASRASHNGCQVHFAKDSDEACQRVVDIARHHGAQVVAKSKSMVTEEIGLNQALQQAGIRAVETDLGEFIVQLRGETPSHIISPAVHLRRQEVAQTFVRELGMPYTTDVAVMTACARQHLRHVFLNASVGVSGVNFGVAETGTLCLVTNEGNGRMVSTVPPVHIAVMGLERLLPSFDDLALMLRLLPRSATGQKITSYVTLLNGPRTQGDPDGPLERHLILVDAGRTRLAAGPLGDILACIRCGACLNACPVFREIGGHAYDSPYPGPIGSVVSPGLFGVGAYGHLAKASTLCGACADACPVDIDLPSLLLRTRQEYVSKVPQNRWLRWGMAVYAWMATNPRRYRLAQRMAGLALRSTPRNSTWIPWLPPPLNAWTRHRHFPPFSRRPFRERWEAGLAVAPLSPHFVATPARRQQSPTPTEAKATAGALPLLEKLARELEALGAQFVPCSANEAPGRIVDNLLQSGAQRILAWQVGDPLLTQLVDRLHASALQVDFVEVPRQVSGRQEALAHWAEADAGVTGASAAIAETGTIILPTGHQQPALASLLPPIHIAILRASAIFPDLESWLEAGGRETVASSSSVALISGPSRTADIELTLTIGVHGPRSLLVYCVQ